MATHCILSEGRTEGSLVPSPPFTRSIMAASSSSLSSSSSSDSSSSSSSCRSRRLRHRKSSREEALKVRKKHRPRDTKRKRKHRASRGSYYSSSDGYTSNSSSDSEREMSDSKKKYKRSERTKKSKEKDRGKKSRRKHDKHNTKEIKQDKRSSSPVQLSRFLGRDKEDKVRRSAVSGKKILLKMDKSKEDKLAENNRNELLKFLNASYD